MALIGVGLYVHGSAEAVKLYCAAFGLKLDYHVLNDDGSFFHSELCLDGEPMLAVVESAEAAGAPNPVQLGHTFDGREELLAALDLLSEGGNILMAPCELPWSPLAAEVVDRFGIRWYLTVPQHRPADDFTPADCV